MALIPLNMTFFDNNGVYKINTNQLKCVHSSFKLTAQKKYTHALIKKKENNLQIPNYLFSVIEKVKCLNLSSDQL